MKPLRPQPDLTIVIPAYREAKRIGKSLDELAFFLIHDATLRQCQVEVLIVAADAPDDTEKIVQAKMRQFKDLRLLKPGPKVGKGRDVQYGMLRSRGKTVIFMDADLATPLKYLPLFMKAYEAGFDVVIGVRNLRKHHASVMRRVLSNAGNLLFRFAGGAWIEDSQCGFKLFSQQACQLCFSKLTILGWGFDMEVLAIAKTNKQTIKCIRINDWVPMADGTFDEGVVKNSLFSLLELAKIFANRLKGLYRQ